jgi:DNA-binding response OmpR family regulator
MHHIHDPDLRTAPEDRKVTDMIGNATAKILPRDQRSRPLAIVVNDTQEILDLFKDILEEEGFDAVLASYAPKELDAIIEIDPDVVILDYLIGDEAQGWQLLQKMKMHRKTRDVPCVVCTGAVSLIKELEGHLAAKNVGVVIKPFDIDDLMSTVRMTMDANANASSVVARGDE